MIVQTIKSCEISVELSLFDCTCENIRQLLDNKLSRVDYLTEVFSYENLHIGRKLYL
jgi:hypothetical protein